MSENVGAKVSTQRRIAHISVLTFALVLSLPHSLPHAVPLLPLRTGKVAIAWVSARGAVGERCRTSMGEKQTGMLCLHDDSVPPLFWSFHDASTFHLTLGDERYLSRLCERRENEQRGRTQEGGGEGQEGM